MKDKEITKINLQQALWATREEKGGISLEEIVKIIRQELDEAECEALIKELSTKSN